ncbi:WD-40 repeat protein [Toxoplasma gondii TgCatPRC2]|uniref:WD40 repeat-containing protein SMU1 n=25 Tax=Toxoplasma gondii TaxID=5811 RepID=B9PTG1_TOXGV|nr:WD-40 repeat protein [Toxoplasma gondii ME49]EPR59809.1 WD-40 repeat protein [Toxoplasma gondii GT1]ESS33925.1 WD-40 repeat protein [Toxoplasma gondii VEG]KAF4644525.1 WD-40 repeat protein [Toxoplasma gondii]KYF45015.1 WD-40 repeat protein [Toxoplasma gondii ARI]KYK69676.1 WD-40 repeat protein [Toxoplasma gondii TgCatPRC2]|eukprot:XP_002368469.1 WD-40 repeat protein [Toxoplasma gondii ME49]
MATNLEIDSADVIRLILQFLQESNLTRTLQVLQEETGVYLNSVESVEEFASDVQQGRWDTVLQTVSHCKLQDETLHLLYEQVLCEMLELREVELARCLLRETSVFNQYRLHYPEKFKRLELLCNKPFFDPKDVYEHSTKDRRRAAIAQAIANELQSVPSSRLLTLLGMSLKYQKQKGMLPAGEKFDLFLNAASTGKEGREEFPVAIAKTIKFGSKSHPECAAFSPDGHHLVSGSIDGFVEVWEWTTGQLNKELAYQKEDALMMHESAVVAVEFSRDSEVLATGSQDGQLKVWIVATGQCARKFDRAHDGAITSISFSKDNTHLLTSSFDTTARIHGLKSGKTLKEFRGHLTFVNCALYLPDNTRVVTGSADGKVKIWDAKTQDCLHTFAPPLPPYMNASQHLPAINNIILAPKHGSEKDMIYVCSKTSTIMLMTLDGHAIKTWSSGKKQGGDFVFACLSPRGEWLYCAGEDNTLYCFANATGKLEHVMKIHEKDTIGVAHHPHHNVMASWGCDGCLNLLRP